MTKGIQTSALGMLPKTVKLEVIANNLANINTTGYKKSDVFIRELIKADLSLKSKGDGLQETNVLQEDKIDYSQGNILETKNPLDVAISGNGFFVIETPDGFKYTRNGNFTLSAEGSIVTSDGYRVMGDKGAIYLPNVALTQEKQINISAKGEVMVGKKYIDKLQLVDFNDENGDRNLKYAGNNLLVTDENFDINKMSVVNSNIKQGFLEQSNVNPLEEMIKMIELNTAMQMDQKSIRYQDLTLQQANEIGKL
jgi:flagellar basal-body rod protein FlgF